MNKTIIAERFSKAISTYPREANVQRQIADKMIRLLQKHIPSPCPKVIEFGCGTGIYSRMLLRTLRPEELLLNDLCPEMRSSKGVIHCSTVRDTLLSVLLGKRI